MLHKCRAFIRENCMCAYMYMYADAVSVIRLSDLHHSFNYQSEIRTKPRVDSVVELLRGNSLPYKRSAICEYCQDENYPECRVYIIRLISIFMQSS